MQSSYKLEMMEQPTSPLVRADVSYAAVAAAARPASKLHSTSVAMSEMLTGFSAASPLVARLMNKSSAVHQATVVEAVPAKSDAGATIHPEVALPARPAAAFDIAFDTGPAASKRGPPARSFYIHKKPTHVLIHIPVC